MKYDLTTLQAMIANERFRLRENGIRLKNKNLDAEALVTC